MFATLALLLAPANLPGDGWIALEQPAVESTGSLGCGSQRTVRLDDDHWHVDGDKPEKTFDRIHVFAELDDGEPRRLRVYTPDCVIEDAGDATRVTLAPADAVALLGGWLRAGQRRQVESELLAAIAHIAHADTDEVLAEAAKVIADEDRSQQALFWLAQRRGERGRAIAVAHLAPRWPLEHREHAVMALALSRDPIALEHVRAVARNADEPELRAHAVLGLGIVQAPGALADLHSIFLADEDARVREQAIFGLAQLDHPEAAETLTAIARDPRHGEHRRTALFWLANMRGGERAIDALVEEML